MEVPMQIDVSGGKEKTLELKYSKDFYLTQKRNMNANYSIKYDMLDVIKAPISMGDKVGVAQVLIDGNIIGEVEIVAKEDIDKQTFKDIMGKIIDKFGFVY